ncbi:hypothetical protein [Methylorubrum extorquens]|uniref:hypothetical protein n=1 Tax=Methylorubrum extorquens TaxID=408 RepID=UPI001EE5842A|nr:hypothetical protein [Methylorubrum extorquens]MCG5245317.1 hypothetical protein [Methylorubrum extorquens]
MSETALPWRQITTDDYHLRIFYPATTACVPWIASSDRVYALLNEQCDGKCRLRPILREAVDLKPEPKADPRWY